MPIADFFIQSFEIKKSLILEIRDIKLFYLSIKNVTPNHILIGNSNIPNTLRLW